MAKYLFKIYLNFFALKKITIFLLRFLYGNKADTDPQKMFHSLQNIPRLLRLIVQTSPKMTAATVVLRLLSSVLPVLMLYAGKMIVDQSMLIINNSQTNTETLWIWVGIELFLAVFSEILGRFVQVLNVLIGEEFANESSVRLIKHAAILDLYYFENPEFYDQLDKARQQTNNRVMILWEILSLFQRSISVFFLAAGLVAFNAWLLLILLLAVIPSFLSETHFNVLKRSTFMNYTPQRRELDYLRKIGAGDLTAKELKIFNLSDFIAKRFSDLSAQFHEANKILTVKSAFWGGLFFSMGTFAYYGAYVFIIFQTISGKISLGDLTFLAGSFGRMREQLQTIMEMFSGMSAKAMYLQDFFDFFELKPNIKNVENPKPVPKPIKQGFTFENVGFSYPKSDKFSVRHLSFELKAGEKLALVGENGAGKTTLVKLLARLYEPTEGRILLDGIDLKLYDLADLRDSIGIIFQDFVRFDFTAAENIAIGDIKESQNMPKIESAAEKSLADELVNRLPKKYDQLLGSKFADSVNLSGGEWQKIAIARSYMRDSQLLILDEPTAALDARAEHEVFLRFSKLVQGKSAILISHRFSTVRMADRILFLEKGEIREIGSHEELLALNGKYAELFNLQAKGYQ